jgi:hypothetical protein
MARKLLEIESIFSPKYDAMNIHDWVERKLHAFLISAQDGELFTLTSRSGIFADVSLCSQTKLNLHRNYFPNRFYTRNSSVMLMAAMIPLLKFKVLY